MRLWVVLEREGFIREHCEKALLRRFLEKWKKESMGAWGRFLRLLGPSRSRQGRSCVSFLFYSMVRFSERLTINRSPFDSIRRWETDSLRRLPPLFSFSFLREGKDLFTMSTRCPPPFFFLSSFLLLQASSKERGGLLYSTLSRCTRFSQERPFYQCFPRGERSFYPVLFKACTLL